MFEFLKKLFSRSDASKHSSSGPDPVAVYAVTSDTAKKDHKPGQGDTSDAKAPGADTLSDDGPDGGDGDFDFD